MPTETIREIVREVLAEELGKLRHDGLLGGGRLPARQIREEVVSIRSDAELAEFVDRLATILKDGRSREEIEARRWVFRLGNPAVSGGIGGNALEQRGAPPAQAAPRNASARIERGIVSERQIDALAPETTHLVLGKAVRLTPLALDRIRLRRISITRTS